MAEIVVTVDIDAPAEQVWQALVDWDRQGEWMLGTQVRATEAGGQGVGSGIVAHTGVGRLQVRDTMVVTQWDPPRRCVVRHTGRVVRGAAAFEVNDLGDGRSQLVWSEWLTPPLGLAGAVGWRAVRPAMRWGLVRSLQNFARIVEAPAG